MQSAALLAQPRRRRALWLGVAMLQLLLMGSAFVGGRMLAQQNLRTSSPGFASQLPSQLPKEPPADSGFVQKVQGKVFTLGKMPPGGAGVIIGGSGGPDLTKQTEVVISSDTKFYKMIQPKPEEMQKLQRGGAFQFRAEDATVDDARVGSMIMVWGTKSGDRTTAEVIYIQSF